MQPEIKPYTQPCVYCRKPVERPGWQKPEARANPALMDCVDCGNKRAARKIDGCALRFEWDWRNEVWIDHQPRRVWS